MIKTGAHIGALGLPPLFFKSKGKAKAMLTESYHLCSRMFSSDRFYPFFGITTMGQKIKPLLQQLLLLLQHFEHSDKPARQQTRRRHATGSQPGGGAPPPAAGPTRAPAKQPPRAVSNPEIG